MKVRPYKPIGISKGELSKIDGILRSHYCGLAIDLFDIMKSLRVIGR